MITAQEQITRINKRLSNSPKRVIGTCLFHDLGFKGMLQRDSSGVSQAYHDFCGARNLIFLGRQTRLCRRLIRGWHEIKRRILLDQRSVEKQQAGLLVSGPGRYSAPFSKPQTWNPRLCKR